MGSQRGATTKARIIELTGSFTGTVILCGDRLDGLFAESVRTAVRQWLSCR